MVKTETIIRTGVLVLALTNQLLTATGHNPLPVSDEQLADLMSAGITIGASLWAWWKNNSFTTYAICADDALDRMRKGGAMGK